MEVASLLFADETETLAEQDEFLTRDLVLSDRIANDCLRMAVTVYVGCET